MKTYYFDYNATTPLDPRVFEAMKPALLEHFGNPSSLHQAGREPAKILRNARRQVADLLNAEKPHEIVFTSGGTEGNSAAIFSALKTQSGRSEIITSSVEHASVLKLFRQLRDEGVVVHEIPVDQEGRLDVGRLRAALSPKTALVSLMLVNNEVGNFFPLEELAGEIKAVGALFHVDAVQAVGKCKVDVQKLNCDFLTIAAHKFYGPKGVGALYVKEGREFYPLVWGGSQERGKRAGTENVSGIAGMGKASEIMSAEMDEELCEIREFRDFFEKEILEAVEDVSINGDIENRLPTTSHIYFEGVLSESLLASLDSEGVCVSSGSACMSGSGAPSHVLTEMGFDELKAKSSIRFSFGRFTTKEEVNFLLERVKFHIEKIRALKV